VGVNADDYCGISSCLLLDIWGSGIGGVNQQSSTPWNKLIPYNPPLEPMAKLSRHAFFSL